jgi:RNA recognition motif-containing protein
MAVTNLHNTTTKKELEKLFSVYGRIKQVEFGAVEGEGLVEMYKKSEARKAILALDGSEFKCCTIRVEERTPLENG